jgi:uncharacterized Zn finger protein
MSINYLEKITELYAFVSVDEGGEGVIGESINIGMRNTFMPFVCADKERMESLKPRAKEIAKLSGKKIKLIRLTTREEIEEF